MNQGMSFGSFVRQRRREMDLTQEELARRVGCAAITLRKIEADDLRPSIQIAERLAMALAIPLDDRSEFVRRARAVRSEAADLPKVTPSPSLDEIGREDLTGRAIRGYALAERIGMGGMGSVYRAVQPNVDREVAVKIILPAYANHPDFIRRFEAEAQLVARLEHPHIVPLYDYWREPGVAYLVMRLLRGGNVQSLMGQGALSLETTSHILEQICSALNAAHRIGVIHRDLKPANVLLDEDQNAYLADFGIAKNISNPDLENQTQVDEIIGTPQYMSPEQIRSLSIKPQTDIYCLGVMLYEMLTGSLPFAGPTPFDMIQQHINSPLPPLAARSAGLPAALDAVLSRATAKNPSERYEDMLSLYQDFRSALGGMLEARPIPIFVEEENNVEIANPFKGLRAFSEADAENFFGREALVQQLLARLGEGGDLNRFLAVIGPSGSGKSSVVRAGLIPALRRGALPGSENWFIVDMLPGKHPFEELETSLLRVAVNPPEHLLSQMKDGDRGLLRAVHRILPADPSVELVLVIDQFEEMFTLVEDESERSLLLENLAAAVLDERSRLHVVITLRADFTDKPLRYVDFGELINRRFEFVLPLTPDELERAIINPAKRTGLKLETGLASTIIREIGNQPGALPLMQYALSELFEKREGRTLTAKAYREIGGVLGALGRSAESIYSKLDETAQSAARQLFLRLVTLGEGTEDTRRRILREELDSLTAIHDPLSTVIDIFGKARLLSFDRDPITRGASIEVAHEAVLREWTRLRGWLTESRSDVRMQRQLATAANEWLGAKQDVSFLITGSRLEQFEGWASNTTIALTQTERSFLTASVAERDRRASEEQARQRRELEAAQKLAETERLLANRLRTRNRIVTTVGVIAIILAMLAGAFGWQSNQNSIAAQNNAATAQAAKDNALNAQSTAEAERLRADNEKQLATSRELAAAAITNLQVDPERSILLALEAISIADTYEAEDALHRAVQASRIELTLQGHTNEVWDAAFSPDGSRIATASLDGTIKVWNAFTGEEQLTLSGHTGMVISVVFNHDGTRLATSGIDKTARIWDVQSGSELFTLTDHTDEVWDVAYSPDGKRLATVSNDGTVKILDASTGKLLKTLQEADDVVPIGAVAFSPDGSRLVTGDEAGNVILWDSVTYEKLISLSDPSSYVSALAFNPDGIRLAVAYNRSATIWDTTTGQGLIKVSGHTASMSGIAFGMDGTLLITSAQDGIAKVWNASSGREMFTLYGHAGPIYGIAISPTCTETPFKACGTRLATTSRDYTAKIWDISPAGSRELITVPSFVSNFSPDGSRLYTTNLTSDGAEILTWDMSNEVGQKLQTITLSHGAPITAGSMNADKTRIATVDINKILKVWDALTGKQLYSFQLTGFSDYVYNIAFSRDGSLVATSTTFSPVRVWDVVTGQELFTLPENNVFTFSPNGTALITDGGDNDDIVKVWDVSTRQEVLTLIGHQNWIANAVFSPDGKRLGTTSLDGMAMIWDYATGKNLLTLSGHKATVNDISFSADGKFLATGSNDGTAKVWDAVTGQELLTLFGHSGWVGSAVLNPDGTRLATGSYGDGTVRVYLLKIEDLIALAKSRVTRSLTTEECQKYLHVDMCPGQN